MEPGKVMNIIPAKPVKPRKPVLSRFTDILPQVHHEVLPPCLKSKLSLQPTKWMVNEFGGIKKKRANPVTGSSIHHVVLPPCSILESVPQPIRERTHTHAVTHTFRRGSRSRIKAFLTKSINNSSYSGNPAVFIVSLRVGGWTLK